MTTTDALDVPEPNWEPPQWLAGPRYSKRQLMWLCAQQAERVTRLQIELRRVRHQHVDANGDDEEPLPTSNPE